MNIKTIGLILLQVVATLAYALTVALVIKVAALFMVPLGMRLADSDGNFPEWLFWFDNRKHPKHGWSDGTFNRRVHWAYKLGDGFAEWYYRAIRNGGSNFMRWAIDPTAAANVYTSPGSKLGFFKGPKWLAYRDVIGIERDLKYLSNFFYLYQYDKRRPWIARFLWCYMTPWGFYLQQYFGFKFNRGAESNDPKGAGFGFTFRPLPIIYRDEDKA